MDVWQALDDQQAAMTSAKLLADAAAVQAAPDSPHKLPPTVLSKLSKEDQEWVAMGERPQVHEGFTRRHSCSDLPTSPRRVPSYNIADDGSDGTIVRPKPLHPHARAEVKENKVLSTEPPRSPTPHPRHGMFVDRDGQERMLPACDQDGKQVRAMVGRRDNASLCYCQHQGMRSSKALKLMTRA